jgi:hypothetical protein
MIIVLRSRALGFEIASGSKAASIGGLFVGIV